MGFFGTEKPKPQPQQQPYNGKWSRSALFLAMSSSVSVLFTHPADVVRVQMQSQFGFISPSQVLRQIVRYRGLHGIYYGLLAAVQREFIYCILRFSLYERARSLGLIENFWRKVQYAAVSGYFAGFILTPITKVSLRIKTDAARPPYLRYNYAHVFHGLYELHREGGLKNFYNMSMTCALRGMLLTVCQLSIYHQVKEVFLKYNIRFRQDWECYFLASAIAGSITAIALTPIDLVENIGHNTHAKQFSYEWNAWNIVQSLNRYYRWHGFFRGLIVNCLRSPPQTILTFLIYEQIFLKQFKI